MSLMTFIHGDWRLGLVCVTPDFRVSGCLNTVVCDLLSLAFYWPFDFEKIDNLLIVGVLMSDHVIRRD